MKNSLKFILNSTALFFVTVPLFAQQKDTIFDIRPEERGWLRYAIYTNEFENSTVRFSFGEIKIKHPDGSQQRINLLPTLKAEEEGKQQDSAERGEATALLAHGRTGKFTLLPGDSIRSYRELELLGSPCDQLNDSNETGGGRPGGWDVLDRTEFVVHIKRASDDLTLASIDSVGILQGTGEQGPLKYGLHPTFRYHTVPVSGITAPTEVYIQVSPRRYGPTPYGISMFQHQNRFPATFSMDLYGYIKWQPGEFDNLMEKRFQRVLAYCDSAISVIGELPSYIYNFHKSEYLQAFWDRYYDATTLPNGKKIYHRKNTNNGVSKRGAISSEELSSAVIRAFVPNPVQNNERISISLEIPEELPYAKLEISTVNGEYIAQLWDGKLSRGNNSIVVQLQNYAAGTYFISLLNANNQLIASKKLSIDQ